ncbi:MAG: alpha/beta fold hydrolase [Candidatus Kapaibacterium sp.]
MQVQVLFRARQKAPPGVFFLFGLLVDDEVPPLPYPIMKHAKGLKRRPTPCVPRPILLTSTVLILWFSTLPVRSAAIDETRSARERAVIAMKSGDFRSAVHLYELWLSAVPLDTSAYARYAAALMRSSLNDKALEALRLGVARGYADVAQLQSDIFAPLQTMKGWVEIVRDAKAHAERSAEFPVYLCEQRRFGRFRVHIPSTDSLRDRAQGTAVHGDRGAVAAGTDSVRRYHPVLLLHGNGQTPEVMLRWAKALRMPDVAFICPEAPYTKVRESLSDNVLRLSAAPDDIAAPSAMRAEVMAASADWYMAAFDEAKRSLPLIDEKPVVMGFSQGGFYASIVAMRHAEKVRSLVMLSASYYPEAQFKVHAGNLRRNDVDVLHTHGRADKTVPFSTAERIEVMLEASKLRHVFVPYDGEHWMSQEVDEMVRAWIRDHFTTKWQ